MAAAPDFPARPAFRGRIRARAAVAFIVCLSALGSVGSYAWHHRVRAAGLDASPFKIDVAAWRAVLAITATDPSCPRSVPVVILYVSGSCVHCRSELARWSGLMRSANRAMSCIGLVVAAAPGNDPAPATWLPAELERTLVWDHDRTIARALNVRLVPLAAYVTGAGVVIARVAGEASETSTVRRLADLRHSSAAGTGVR
ncbi:MAG: hypothetical protein ACHQQR_03200 [Gemmatimonadales bacterium]